jgi:hypothetical protein
MNITGQRQGRRRGLVQAAALVAAGALTGVVLATTQGASAASTADTSATSYSAAVQPDGAGPGNPRSSSPVRGDEQALSSADAAALKAAALKAVPGGTVYRVESDAGDGAYEAHMTKVDGSAVTVKFDKNMAVIKVEAGMGTGDPGPAGQQPPAGQSRSGA